MEFERLFTISAFEGLRLVRALLVEQPQVPIAECADVLVARSPEAKAYDLEAATYLHGFVNPLAPAEGVKFYRECVTAVMVREMPAWAKVMTIGRGRFLKSISGDEYRDILSVFREAQLLEEPPSDDDISWWDAIKERVRSDKNLEAMARARQAEKLTLHQEQQELANLGIDEEPAWVAIEDDTVGYDVRSYRIFENVVRPIMIEVKSTIASPLRFNVTRNEWRQADKVGEGYRFHVWDLTKNPPQLFERTVEQVRPHIPQDGVKGQWTNVLMPVAIDQVPSEGDVDWEKTPPAAA